MICPHALRPGDRVGVVTPSSPGPLLFPARWQKGLAALRALGLEPVEGALASRRQAYRSAPPRERAKELNDFIYDDRIHGIIACIGGWNSSSLLPYLDYAAFARTPKPVIGYSDFSAVLLALQCKTDVVTFHGPAVIPSFGEWPAPFAETIESFEACVMRVAAASLAAPAFWTDEYLEWTDGSWMTRPRTLCRNQGWQALRPGVARGALVGGNLDTLVQLLGTEYCTSFESKVLFFEESEKALREYERNLNQLRLNGVFDRIAGLVVGKHERLTGEDQGLDRIDLLQEFVGELSVPVLIDVDIGHTAPMLTLPLGVAAEVDAERRTIRLLEAAVRV